MKYIEKNKMNSPCVYSAADQVRPSLQEQRSRSCDAADYFEHFPWASNDITNSPK